MIIDLTKLYQVDDAGLLFISPIIKDWGIISSLGIDIVIDLEGGLDECIPTLANSCLYIYFPIFDEELPDLPKLEAISRLGAQLIENGQRVLSHCGMGFNRSALVAARILHNLGMSGDEIVQRLRERRPGALFNEIFEHHVLSLPPPRSHR
ncbi:MAG TPA: dual specificity protein phosphatase family protein [Thermoanaerobaculia bacterium]|nr:dual specificity protein phosphatase family protein [Thermoanaerobaculia bacterium]